MRTNLIKWVGLAIVSLFMVVGLTSCEDYGDTEMNTRHFTVHLRDWDWNDVYKRYECQIDFSAINRRILDEGEVQGSVYITETGYGNRVREVIKPLPFVQSYEEGKVTYTETISFDVSLRNITFYIQASDLSDTDKYLTDYQFKVTIFRKKE